MDSEISKVEEMKLRDYIQRLKTDRAAIRMTVTDLESIHVEPPSQETRRDMQRFDLENAVLMQELMAIKVIFFVIVLIVKVNIIFIVSRSVILLVCQGQYYYGCVKVNIIMCVKVSIIFNVSRSIILWVCQGQYDYGCVKVNINMGVSRSILLWVCQGQYCIIGVSKSILL